MSFLDWPVEETECEPRFLQQRKAVALQLIGKFQEIFPKIFYDLLWESATINAQAWRLGTTCRVRVYGGLVRHRALRTPGLALMLAHETGHHLGGLPRDPAMPWLTWQGQADYWAAAVAMPKVFGQNAHQLTLQGAREILQLHRQLIAQSKDYVSDLAMECRYAIFISAASGGKMPYCAEIALSCL